MLAHITPVFGKDVNDVLDGFFRPEFRHQQLGQSGQWWGIAPPSLQLPNPVARADCYKLLPWSRLSTPELVPGTREQTNPLFYRLGFEVSRSMSTLWALGGNHTRIAIERVHDKAVRSALGLIESTATLRPGAMAFAGFRSGATEKQIPHLHTDVLLINRDFNCRFFGKSLRNEKLLSMRQTIDDRYVSELERAFASSLGFIDSGVKTWVPQGLFSGRSAQDGSGYKYEFGHRRSLQGEEVFESWRREATSRGWGPDQAKALLQHAREEFQQRQKGISLDR